MSVLKYVMLLLLSDKKMVSAVDMKRWVIIVPDREKQHLDILLNHLIRDSNALGFQVLQPIDR